MSALTDVVTAFTEDAGVLALIGADNVRPYPLRKDAPLPAITYYLVTTPTTQAIDGSLFERKPRICVQLHGKTMASVDALNEAVLTAARAISGSVTIADAGHDESGWKIVESRRTANSRR